ncbi:hypothetical protein J6590_093354, partial [Homalodisca vitripennis]
VRPIETPNAGNFMSPGSLGAYLQFWKHVFFNYTMSLDERERITLLMMVGWGNNRRSHEEACHLFNDYFHERQPISRTTVGRTVQRFMETGSVSDRHRSGRPATATTEDNSLDVLQSFIENPQESLRSQHKLMTSLLRLLNKF